MGSNLEKLNCYLKSKDYDDLDIVDLVRYVANHFGAKYNIDNKKSKKLDEYINPKEKVLFVLVDGMGYYKVNSLSNDSILKQNLKSSIQTVNPTSTACILTSICSAKYPSEHGVLGWWQYLKSDNINYCPLLFSERKTGTDLSSKGINIKDIFNFESIFDKVNTTVNLSMPREIISSVFSKVFCGNKANTHGYFSIKEGFSNISKKIKQSRNSFNYLYIDGLDLNSHIYGVDSPEVKNIINEVEDGIKKVKEENEDVTVIVTADHGQVDMTSMIYLNQLHDYNKYFYALPSIDTRMISFFVKDDLKFEFEKAFLDEFGDDVILLSKDKIEEYKIFGNTKLSNNALNALGEYVAIVVNNKFMICDKINMEDKLNTKGNHSGLTHYETTIPLIVI